MKFPALSVIYSIYKKNPVIVTDSRKSSAHSIFFSLKGEKFNGNKFAASALEHGCSFAVVDNEEYYRPPLIPPKGGDSGAYSPLRGEGGLYILVKDCLQTLQELAKYHRTQLSIPFLAITGSNGKTTTKELIKSVLSEKYKTLATTGNLNNHIGVPLTILAVTSDTEVAVIEMGANHIGEIALLCEIAHPDYGLITNIGKSHIGEFGSFEAIVGAKTELYDFIRKKNRKIFINSENPLLLSHSSGIETITYGSSEKNFCQCRLSDASPYLKIKYNDEIISTQLIGKYNFENISAAICVGKYFKVENEKIKEAIEEYVPLNNRSQILKTKSNTLILDAYNANPTSMEMAIRNFSKAKFPNKIIVLGDMLELGKFSEEEHKKIFELVQKNDFIKVILVGNEFYKVAKKSTCLLFGNSDEAAEWLKKNPIHNTSILIKGSRGIKLEKVVEWL